MKTVLKRNWLDRYKRFCYLLGRHLDGGRHDWIERLLFQADVEMTPGMFMSIWVITTAVGYLLVFVSSLLLFLSPASPFSNDFWLIYAIILGAIAAVAIGGGFPFYLQNKVSNKKIDIERNLPYALAYMSVFASSGSTPLEVMRRIAEEDYGHISKEFAKVIFRTNILGEDVITAMNFLVRYTPSNIFRSICIDLTNIIYGGGGLKYYLEAKSKDLMNLRRQAYREFVDSLSVYGEGYLGGIVMIVTLSVLGIVISGALSIELGPFTPEQLFSFLIYLIVPLVNIIFLQLLAVKYSTNP